MDGAAKEIGLLIRLTIVYTENRPLKVIVWSRAASTSAKAWWRTSQYPKPARHQLINFIDNTTKEPMQVTAAKLCCSDVFSRRFVRSPTIISCFNYRTARHLIERSQLSSNSSSCSVPSRISSNSLCMAIQQHGLKSGRLCCLGSSAAERVSQIAFQFPTWTISRTKCAPAGRVLANRSSTSPLISGVTDWRQ